MAAMSSAPPTVTTLTPPSSSHGTGYPWDTSPAQAADLSRNTKLSRSHAGADEQPSLHSENGDSPPLGYLMDGGDGTSTRQRSRGASASDMKIRNAEASHLSAPYTRDVRSRSLKDISTPADSLADLYGGNKGESVGDSHKRPLNEVSVNESSDEHSKWIHRDKLARIESEELQAAGIILPRPPRARSKSQSRTRRDQSVDQPNGRSKTATSSIDHTTPRSRKNSEITDPHTPEAWDLRLPEEIEADSGGYWVASAGSRGSSKIPVAKLSPVPIPAEHLERETPMRRRRDGSPGEEDSITYPKPRARSGSVGNGLGGSTSLPGPQPAKRSVTDSSPKKAAATTAGRKASAPGKATNGATGRPKTRGGPSKDSTSSGTGITRPSTRSGERELSSAANKQPEGEPPWMISAYRPDPRLPPEQQLLPTVAKRLQQEKWEREGKFGNVYDKEFRPLNDEGFLEPPAPPDDDVPPEEPTEKKAGVDWPLRPEQAASPPPLLRTGSYSTMPKINDKPNGSPLPSPRNPVPQRQPSPIIRTPASPEDTPEKKDGCGCCIVM